jgi:hypothetical protein
VPVQEIFILSRFSVQASTKICPHRTLLQFLCPQRPATGQAVVQGRQSLNMHLRSQPSRAGQDQGVTKRCRLFCLTNTALAQYMSPNAGVGGRVAWSQLMSTAVPRSQNKLWRSNSIFNLWSEAGVLKNLSLAGLAKLSRLRYS